jgi:hypothetical protein
MFGEGHAPCTIKTSFIDFEKRLGAVAATKD